MKISQRWWMALCASVLLGLASCGGGNDSLSSKVKFGQVYVMGDSLADVGTFGLKFTVQDASNPKGFPIWTQLVSSAVGVDGTAQCNYFSGNGTTGAITGTTATCTNFAIGGGRVVAGAAQGGAASPYNVAVQMATKTSAYSASDLVLVDGGGNDAADLVGAYLAAGTAPATYQNFLLQQLSGAEVAGYLSQGAAGAGLAANAYMQKLATTFYAQIKTNLLDKGATHVGVLNAPDITLTPRFTATLQGVSAAYGGGATGAAAAASLQAAIRTWISTYNTQLKASVGQDSRVAIVDFYADFTDEVTNPNNYSLTNVTTAACPVTGTGTDGLPTYTFPTCTSAALNATPGKTAGWWESYAFSDGFHPTPFGHRLLAASVSRALARAGWI